MRCAFPSHRRYRRLTDSSSPPRQPSPVADIKAIETDGDRNTAQKRKAPSPSPVAPEHTVSPKRSRIEGPLAERGASSEASHVLNDRSAGRRPSASLEEKRRGKRLFGTFLNTLSQTNSSTSSQQKRRQDIERRQHARVSQQREQRAEDDKQRQEKLAKLNVARKIEQVKFDEKVVRNPF